MRAMGTVRVGAIVTLAALLGACGTSSPSSPAAADTAAADAAPPSGYHGTAGFIAYPPNYVGDSPSYQFVAAFFQGPSSDPCAGATMSGNCCFRGVPARASTSPSPPGPTRPPSAGTLSLTDGALSLAVMAPAPATGTYAAIMSMTNPNFKWNAGDTLSVSGSGAAGEIPPFSASVTAVGFLEGVTPSPDDPGDQVTLAAADFVLTWTPDTLPDETVYVSINDPKGHLTAFISCHVSDNAGTLTVPRAFLANFASGDTPFIRFGRKKEIVPPLDATSLDVYSETWLLLLPGSKF